VAPDFNSVGVKLLFKLEDALVCEDKNVQGILIFRPVRQAWKDGCLAADAA
jgi:hypothetical protein